WPPQPFARPGTSGPGGRTTRPGAQGAADDEGNGTARGTMAAVARGGRAPAVDLLSRRQRAQRRARQSENLIEHDLFRKPVPTFRDHALEESRSEERRV